MLTILILARRLGAVEVAHIGLCGKAMKTTIVGIPETLHEEECDPTHERKVSLCCSCCSSLAHVGPTVDHRITGGCHFHEPSIGHARGI